MQDLKIEIDLMTPDEIRDKGFGLQIQYSIFPSPFGFCLVATTNKGICAALFADAKEDLVADLSSRWPNARLLHRIHETHVEASSFLNNAANDAGEYFFRLHLHGTEFQVRVWKALLEIPAGETSTYADIARKLGDKNKSRPVGTAVGNNPIGYLIPCHRVLTSDKKIGGYRWGIERKKKMLSEEGVNLDSF